METKKTSPRYSPAVRAQAVRMVLDHQGDHPSQWASKIGCSLKRCGAGFARPNGTRVCVLARRVKGYAQIWVTGFVGVIRGKPVKTTVSDRRAPCPEDRVDRPFQAERPNALCSRWEKGILAKPLRLDGSRGYSIGRLRNTNRFTRI